MTTMRYIALGLLLLLIGCLPPAPALADGEEVDFAKPTAPPNLPWKVKSIIFKGFDNMSESDAREVMETKGSGTLGLEKNSVYDPVILARDEINLTKLYQEHGFFHANINAKAVKNPDSRTVTITITAHENNPVKISGVQLIFDDELEKILWDHLLRKKIPLKKGMQFELSAYKRSKSIIQRTLANEAHPLNRVDGQVRVYPDKLEAQVVLKISTGPSLLFGPLTIRGNKSVPTHYIQREITFARGEVFSLDQIDKTQSALLDSGFFVNASLTPQFDQRRGAMVPMEVLVEERKAHSLRLGLGYGTEDLFRLRLLQINRNPAGWGDTLTFEGKMSAIYEGLVGRWQIPFVFGPQTQLLLSGGVEQRETEAYVNRRRFFRPMALSRKSGIWAWNIGYNVETDRMLDLKTHVPDPGYENQTFFISSIPFGLSLDTRDSVLNPTKGSHIYLDVEVASEVLGSELSFVRPVLSMSHIVPLAGLGKDISLAARAKGGLVSPLQSNKKIPLVRRFLSGGADSVRGYPYQKLGPLDDQGKPLGGEVMLQGNLELRFPLWQALGGVVFLDAGNVYENLDSELFSMRYTTGAGLRYNTPVGPLRVDLGYQLNPPSNAPFARWEVYFSVGQAF